MYQKMVDSCDAMADNSGALPEEWQVKKIA
jgi:hypothetical protein